jgi:hypothetical protein
LLKVPTEGDIDQFTPGLLVPLSEALNCTDWPPESEVDDGLTDTVTVASNVMVAVATFVGSAALAAATVTVCCNGICDGAVYTPLVTVPNCGDTDQFTSVLLDPLTVGANVADCPADTEALDGVNVIDTVAAGRTSDIVALADLAASAALVALTVTVCAEAMVAGAV